MGGRAEDPYILIHEKKLSSLTVDFLLVASPAYRGQAVVRDPSGGRGRRHGRDLEAPRSGL
jgi:hypothetical protein